MKTRIIRTLLIFLTTALWAGIAHSQTITVKVDSVTPCPGDPQVVVPVNVENLDSAGSLSLAITFDTTVLSFDTVQNAYPGLSSGLFIVNSPPGDNLVKIAFVAIGAPLDIGDGKLLDIVFDYLGGVSRLGFSTAVGDNEISNPSGTAIFTLDTIAGFVDLPVVLSIDSHPIQDSIDEGDTTTFSISASNAMMYQWQVSQDGGISYTDLSNGSIYNGTQMSQLTINGALLSFDDNLYRCIASENNCNQSDTSMGALLNVEEICYPPLVFNITGGGAYCSGGSGVSIGLDGSEMDVDYTLFISGSDTVSVISGTGAAISFGSQTMVGTYTVIGSKACASTNMNGSAQVSTNPLPTIYELTGGGAYCAGGSGLSIGLSGSDTNTTYTLYYNGAVTSNVLAGSGNTLDFGTFMDAGTYTVQAVNSFGCSQLMDLSASIVINPLPDVFNLTGGGAYCDGGMGVDISLSGSETGVDYELYLDGTATGNILPGTASVITFQNITAVGNYTLMAMDTTTSCVSSMNGSVNVTVDPLPAVSMDTLNDVCVNDAVFNFTGGNPAGGVYSGNGVSTGSFDPANAGVGIHTITYTYTDTNNCSATASVNIEVHALPAAFNVTGGGTYCPVNTAPEIGLDGSEANALYTLLLNDTTIAASLPGTGGALNFGPQSQAGVYTVNAVYTSNTPACETMMSGSVQVAILPLEPPIVSTDSVGSIGTDQAMVYGMVDLACGSAISERGIVYSTSPSPTLADNQVVDNNTNLGAYSLQLTGLAEGTMYYTRAYATNNEGTTYGAELSFTTLITPVLTTVGMEASTDQVSWTAVNGDLNTGFDLTLDPTTQYYYLNFANPATQANISLASPGYYGFSVDTYPGGFFNYWDGRGVNASASTGSWQATMWQIINGNLPTFLIKVNADGTFMLVDGLTYALGMPDEYLKVNGDYHLGAYTYTGTITGDNGVVSDPINVGITFIGTQPEFTHVELRSSTDKTTWTDVAGSLSGGFALLLDSTQTYYYIDLKNPETQTNIPLNSPDYFGFYVNTYPANFFNYWDSRGVNATASAGSWQATMWQIINGNLPIFYIKTLANGTFTIVDGLQYALGQPDDFLRINGDYLEGNFTFTGIITGVNGVPSDTLSIPVTITRKCIPPVVMAGPDDLVACQGTPATFSVTIAGSSPFSYQWRYNGVDITGANSASYTINTADLQHEGLYSCLVTNDCGDTLSTDAELTIQLPPSFTMQPSATNVFEGDPASFVVTADNATTYQWQLSLDGGNTWTNLSNGADYGGTHSAQLDIFNPVIAMNGYYYRCIASGDCAPNAYSQSAVLIVVRPVGTIITEAPHMTASSGDTVEVPISVENLYGASAIALTMTYDPAALTYIEYRDVNSALSGSPLFINLVGNELRMQWFSLLPVNIGNDILVKFAFEFQGGYSPLIWKLQPLEACQYGDLQSNPFPAMFINGSINGLNNITISSQPQNTSTCLGSSASFSVTASGATDYLWEVSNDGGASWTSLNGMANYTGATSANLDILATSAAMHLNLYRCLLSDGIDTSYTSPAFLEIIPWANIGLAIIANPGDTVCSGSSVSFAVPGDSILVNPAYTWFLNGVAVGTASSFTLASPTDGDQVKCTILSQESCAAVTTLPISIVVDPLPVILTQPSNQTVYEGDTTTFMVSSPNAAAYQWQVSTDNGASWTDIVGSSLYSGVNTNTLMVNAADLSMNGYEFRCTITEANCGQILNSDAATLTVKQLPIYTIITDQTACPGDQVIVPVNAENFNNVSSASLRLSYDTTVLSFIGFQNLNSAFSSGVMLIDQNMDQISVAYFGLNPVNIGDDLLFEILFTYNGGTTNLVWDPNPAYTMYTNPAGATLEAYFTGATISSKPIPTAYDVNGGGSYCAGGNGVNVGLSNSDTGFDYELYLDGNPTSNIVSGTGTAISFGMQTAAGVYTVKSTNMTTGCTNMMNGSATVVIDPLPVVSLVLSDSNVCVNAASFALNGGMPTGGTYSGTAISNGQFDPATAGTGVYNITYTYIDTNGCENSAMDQITVNPAPVLIISPAAPVICVGETITLSTPGGDEYLWSTGDTTASISVSPTASTTYSVTATNAFGCSVDGSVSVTVNPLPNVSVSVSMDTICEGAWTTLTASGADSYAWSTGSTSNSITVSPATTQSYTVTGTNSFGCSDSATALIHVNPAPMITITPASASVCAGQSTTLTASGGESYTWSTGDMTAAVTVSPTSTTSYVVTATDLNACQNTASADVTVLPLPMAYNVTGGGAYCINGSGVDVSLDNSEMGVDYTLYLDNNMTSTVVSGTGAAISFGMQTAAGTYTVMATDTATGCINNMNGSAIISIDPLPVFSTQPADTMVNIGGTAVFTAMASPATSYQWQLSTDMGATWTDLMNGSVYSGVNTNTLSVGPAAPSYDGYRYRLMVMAATCDAYSNPAILTIDPVIPTITVTAGSGSFCPGDTLLLPIDVTNFDFVGELDLMISWDAAVLDFVGLANPHPALATGSTNIIPGTGNLQVTWTGGPAFGGNTSLASIEMVYMGGSSSLNWDAASSFILNGFGDTITTNYVDGSVDQASQAPVVSTQPADQILIAGDTTMFSITATGAASYQWQVSTDQGMTWTDLMNGSMYSGVTTATLMVNGASTSLDSNLYRAIAFEAVCGLNDISSSAMLHVIPAGLVIETMLDDITACPGSNVVVPVTVNNFYNVSAASLSIAYDTNVVTYANLINIDPQFATGTLIANQNNGELVIGWFNINPVWIGSGTLFEIEFAYAGGITNLTFDTINYGQCQYNDAVGDIIPAVFTDGMIEQAAYPPVITAQPQNLTVMETVPAFFSVSTSATGVSYQWEMSIDGGLTWSTLANGAVYSGVTTASLEVSSPTLAMDGYAYRCIITEPLCSLSTTSDHAVMTVIPFNTDIITTIPDIITCPDTVSIPILVTNVNDVFSISLKLNYDTTKMEYLSFSNVHPQLSTSTVIVGATNSQVGISWISLSEAEIIQDTLMELQFVYYGGYVDLSWDTSGNQNCAYSNLLGTTLDDDYEDGSINSPGPTLFSDPLSMTVDDGDTAVFSVSATNVTAYQWQISTDGGNTWINLQSSAVFTGVNTATMSISPANINMDGYLFRAVLSGACPDVISAPAILSVNPPLPLITTSIGTMNACEGNIVIPLRVSNLIGVSSFNLALWYNTDSVVLNYLGYANTHPALSGGTLSVNSVGDSIILISFTATNTVTVGTDSLMNLLFTATPGNTNLRWNTNNPLACEYLDPQGYTFPELYLNGSIRINPLPETPNMPIGQDTICIGSSSTVYAINSVSYANSYTWNLSPASAGVILGTGLTASVSWNPSFSGNASITVVANNNCGSGMTSPPMMVYVNTKPGQAANPTGPTILCMDDPNSTYTTTGASNASNYDWMITPSYAGTLIPNGTSVDVDWNANFSGYAVLTVRGSNNCGNGLYAQGLLITVYPGITVDLGPDMTVCASNYAVISAGNPGATYQWSTGATTQSIIVDTTGLGTGTFPYSVTVTSNVGCVASDDILVTFDPCVGIVGNKELSVELYPNPTSGAFTIALEGMTEKVDLYLMNMIGEVIRSEQLNNASSYLKKDMDISQLPAGVYLLRLNSGDQSIVRKIVLQ